MGEKIKVLGATKILGKNVDFELNAPVVKGGDLQVHVQGESFRVEMDRAAFIPCAVAIIAAANKLKSQKGL